MTLYNALALVLVLAAAFAYLNYRFLKMPPAIGLMVLGLLTSLGLVGLARLGVQPVLDLARVVGKIDFNVLVMQVMLGFLLFAGSIHVDTRRLGQLRWSVGTLALLGTPLSTVLVGLAMYSLLPLLGLPTPLSYCLVFGALISPTDPVAVLSILTKARINKSLEIKIVGESLFNDGVGVVLFVVLLEVAQLGAQDVTVTHALGVFAQEALGGVALGAALGLGTAWLLRTVNNYQVEVLLTLAVVAGGTALATRLHTSGPLAMVVTGLLVGHFSRQGSVLSDESQDYVDKFWELLDEVLNALLFVLVGLEALVLPITWRIVGAGVLAVVVVLLARLVAVSSSLVVLKSSRLFQPSQHGVPVLTWGGLRGGLSVALALGLPAEAPRELLVGITYVIVVFSIIGQGLTIGPLVRWLGVGGAEPAEESELAEEPAPPLQADTPPPLADPRAPAIPTQFFVVGDIHGCLSTFQELLTHWRPAKELLVQLGDLVDRGNYSPETVELCRELSLDFPDQTVFLQGNHDWGMAAHLGPNGPHPQWLGWGGNDTLHQYEQYPEWLAPHAAWLAARPLIWESAHVVFSHAGLADVRDPLNPLNPNGVLWRRGPLQNRGKRQVVGHTPTDDSRPFFDAAADAIYLDTGAVFGHNLTGLRISETGEVLETVVVPTHPEDIYPFEPLV